METVKLTLFEGGYCHHLEAVAIRGGRWKVCQFASLFGLIEHPYLGNILYDTGYTTRFHQETSKLPYKLYALTTPVYIQDSETAKSQLAKLNISAEDINYIFISHFHADHIAGLRDFPNAKFVCLKSAYGAVKNKSGFQACRQGFIPALLPENFLDRLIFADEQPLCKLSEEYFPFTFGHDIFCDGSLIAIELPGHVVGQMGVILLNQHNQKIFLVADACWLSKAYRENRPPHAITRLIHSNHTSYLNTLNNLHLLYQRNTELKIIPSHCAEIRKNISEINEGLL